MTNIGLITTFQNSNSCDKKNTQDALHEQHSLDWLNVHTLINTQTAEHKK